MNTRENAERFRWDPSEEIRCADTRQNAAQQGILAYGKKVELLRVSSKVSCKCSEPVRLIERLIVGVVVCKNLPLRGELLKVMYSGGRECCRKAARRTRGSSRIRAAKGGVGGGLRLHV